MVAIAIASSQPNQACRSAAKLERAEVSVRLQLCPSIPGETNRHTRLQRLSQQVNSRLYFCQQVGQHWIGVLEHSRVQLSEIVAKAITQAVQWFPRGDLGTS
jgi:hypothetical protein